MMTTLRQVLQQFEQRSGAVSLAQMARDLRMDRAMLQEMLDYWVRKGRLREVNAPGCASCGVTAGCPLVVLLPRMYELASDASARENAPPACGCSMCRR